MLHFVDFIRQARICAAVFSKSRRPVIAVRLSTNTDPFLKMVIDAVGYQELRVLGPSIKALGQLYFFLAERLAVRLLGILPVRRAPADMAVYDDQRRAVARSQKIVKARANQVQVVGVGHVGDIPSV